MDRARSVSVEGRGLHHGANGRVTIVPHDDPSRETTLNGAPLGRWHAVPAERSTAIACGEMRARTVEHLFAALAARGLGRGIDVRLEGTEPPILDGCAGEWSRLLPSLAVAATAPALVIAREAVIEVATSRYAFAPGEGTNLSIELELDDARILPRASWGGDLPDFEARIAPARTFCFAHELEAFARAGLASHVRPEMVVVIGPSILAAGRPFEPDEPARHKLLDLIGDLFLYGGPPRGSIAAYRPGHGATHEAVRVARERGVLVPIPTPLH
jgi:UDP-3-O-[3-hydroxymyristoyl] N-acetylglucosamine deacetylase